MSSGFRKVKTAGKMFNSNPAFLRNKTMTTLGKAAQIVGSTFGPGGRNVIIESELPNIPNKNTKDGVTVFKSLGSDDSFEHLILEQARDAASRTASEAGDGTTTATILSEAIVRHLFNFCIVHRKYSPQRAMREINAVVRDFVVPFIKEKSIQITDENIDLLKRVATVSANGDTEMAQVVMETFDKVGFSDSSHVVIQELTGPSGYEIEHITGFPMAAGYEDSCGKFWQTFITDKGNETVSLESPKFVLFDGAMTDLVKFYGIIDYFGQRYTSGDSDFKNLVLCAHGFSESVLLELSVNMTDSKSLNVIPLKTPMTGILNSQSEFLHDLSAFTGAKVIGFDFNIHDLFQEMQKGGPDGAQAEAKLLKCFGNDMDSIVIQKYRSTLVGTPEEMNIEVRTEDLKKRVKNAANTKQKELLEERIGILTSGIAKLKVFGASNGELKEKHDRCEDAVCAVRAAVKHGVTPGGCRTLLDIAQELTHKYGPMDSIYQDVLDKVTKNNQRAENGAELEEFTEEEIEFMGAPSANVVACVLTASFLEPFYKLLDNVGLNEDETNEIFMKMMEDENLIYDADKHTMGSFKELGIYDAELAVEEAIKNATSIATILGTLGGIVAFPRDHELERRESSEVRDYMNMMQNPTDFVNEANERY